MAALLSLTACAEMGTTERRVATGTLGGAAGGAALGAIGGSAALGAAAGAAAGALGGYVYDRHQAAEE
jgi:hypothetical protein